MRAEPGPCAGPTRGHHASGAPIQTTRARCESARMPHRRRFCLFAAQEECKPPSQLPKVESHNAYYNVPPRRSATSRTIRFCKSAPDPHGTTNRGVCTPDLFHLEVQICRESLCQQVEQLGRKFIGRKLVAHGVCQSQRRPLRVALGQHTVRTTRTAQALSLGQALVCTGTEGDGRVLTITCGVGGRTQLDNNTRRR